MRCGRRRCSRAGRCRPRRRWRRGFRRGSMSTPSTPRFDVAVRRGPMTAQEHRSSGSVRGHHPHRAVVEPRGDAVGVGRERHAVEHRCSRAAAPLRGPSSEAPIIATRPIGEAEGDADHRTRTRPSARASWPASRCASSRPRGGVPHPDDPVVAAGDDPGAVRAVGGGLRVQGVGAQDSDLAEGERRLPQRGRGLLGRRGVDCGERQCEREPGIGVERVGRLRAPARATWRCRAGVRSRWRWLIAIMATTPIATSPP